MFGRDENVKLVSVISILLIAGFLITTLASYFVSRASLRSEISTNELPLTSDNIYSEIQRDLFRPVFVSSLMATDTFVRDWVLAGEVDEQQIVRYLQEIKTKYNAVTSFFVSDLTNKYYYPNGVLKKVSKEVERDAWYFRVRNMDSFYEVNIDHDMANKDAMTIFINHRVFDYEGNFIGATGVGLTVNAVSKLIEIYQQKYERTIYFIDREGDIELAGSGFDGKVKNISQYEDYALFQKAIVAKEESSFSYERNGQVTHANIRYVDEFKWFLVVEQAEQKTIRHIFTTLIVNLIICGVVVIIVLFLVNISVNAYQQKVETLRGIVPICSYCKQIRDDEGYWNRVEAYISKHTEAQFSHSICPTCLEKHHPEEYESIREEGGKGCNL